MGHMWLLYVVGVVLAYCVGHTQAVNCYECTASTLSTSDPCNQPLDESALSTTACESGEICYTQYYHSGRGHHTERGCVQDKGWYEGCDKKDSLQGVDTVSCFCNYDKCNSATLPRGAGLLVSLGAILLVVQHMHRG